MLVETNHPGYIKDTEIKNLIGEKNSKELEKYIKLILKDSSFCDEESDGYELFLQKNNRPKEGQSRVHRP